MDHGHRYRHHQEHDDRQQAVLPIDNRVDAPAPDDRGHAVHGRVDDADNYLVDPIIRY